MAYEIEKMNYDKWKALTETEREEQARVIREVSDAQFVEIINFERGDQSYPIALFSKDHAGFALIPGGPVELGYKQGQDIELSTQSRKDWLECLRDCDVVSEEEDLNDYFTRILSAQRRLVLRPFLIETTPIAAHYYLEDADEDDEKASCHQIIDAALEKLNYRLPTSDQWEWACSGGSRELFPWGKSPIRSKRLESSYGSGLIDPKPNAFGLHLNLDPYNCECTTNETLMRAGDGGARICDGMFDTFITQASAYFEDISDSGAIPEFYETALVRRVIPL